METEYQIQPVGGQAAGQAAGTSNCTPPHHSFLLRQLTDERLEATSPHRRAAMARSATAFPPTNADKAAEHARLVCRMKSIKHCTMQHSKVKLEQNALRRLPPD